MLSPAPGNCSCFAPHIPRGTRPRNCILTMQFTKLLQAQSSDHDRRREAERCTKTRGCAQVKQSMQSIMLWCDGDISIRSRIPPVVKTHCNCGWAVLFCMRRKQMVQHQVFGFLGLACILSVNRSTLPLAGSARPMHFVTASPSSLTSGKIFAARPALVCSYSGVL